MSAREWEEYNKGKLEGLLRKLANEREIRLLVDKVFQRAPDIADEMFQGIEEYPKTHRKNHLVNKIVSKITFLTNNLNVSRDLGLPRKITDYVKYIDLFVLTQRSKSKTWKVYHLENYKKPENWADLDLLEIAVQFRYKLKSTMRTQGYCTSVQTETEDNRLWFSISYVRKTKNKDNDKRKLLKARYQYLVHYPGEPYLYLAGAAKLPDELGKAFVDCVEAKGYKPLPLQGKYLDSLRQLRLNREVQGSKARLLQQSLASASLEDPNLGSIFKHPAPVNENCIPLMDNVRVDAQVEFRDYEPLQRSEELDGKKLSIRLECHGDDVIGGLHDMAEAGLIRDNPLPRWIQDLTKSGRNLVTLVPSSRREKDSELQSILSTASTIRIRE
eukprot:TRINITY_DN9727_c0_g1_i1.p1 TRINITY_DN9727_c0_g1~~TRINITY_DN9727_c0_g1_i1.p1  ORF type:complete len:386 (+),score=59.37 TRINITY_DN9727_c0_g1_i1:44-1201(+)